GRSGAALVVVVRRGELDDLVRERPKLLDGLGARRQCVTAGLIGQRDRYLRIDGPRERLDHVALEWSQVIKAVQEDRAMTPACWGSSKRIERAPGAQLGIGSIQALELAAVRQIDRRE